MRGNVLKRLVLKQDEASVKVNMLGITLFFVLYVATITCGYVKGNCDRLNNATVTT